MLSFFKSCLRIRVDENIFENGEKTLRLIYKTILLRPVNQPVRRNRTHPSCNTQEDAHAQRKMEEDIS